LGYSGGTSVRFADVFPERAKILDDIFGYPPVVDTAWQKQQTAAMVQSMKATVKAGDTPAGANVLAKQFGVSADVVKKAKEIAIKEALAEQAAEQAAAAAQATAAKQMLTAKDLSFGDKTGIGVKAGNAKKAALAEGKSMAEAQAIFDQTKAQLTANRLAELNGTGATVVATAQANATGVMTDQWRTAANTKAGKHINAAGKVSHPKAKMQGVYADAQAKSNIAAELAERMNNEQDWAVFREYAVKLGQGDPGPFNAPNPNFASGGQYGGQSFAARGMAHQTQFPSTPENIRQWILDSEAANRVQMWAGTSGDTAAPATAMQHAIKEEFGTTGDPIVRATPSYHAEHTAHYAKVAPFYRRFARRMYEHTQEQLAKEGITEVAVYRGMDFNSGRPTWAMLGQSTRPDLQPANSWSTVPSVAQRFGSTRFTATIPASRIIGSARTGFGCLNEKEYVIMATDGLAKVGRFGDPT
jgi:hypothetical protein